MPELTEYGARVIDRISMIGMWIAVVVSVRNFFVCFRQYRRTHGLIHLMNMGQVVVLFIHRFIYGLVPLFELTTCSFWPLLVSLWHIDYLLFYAIMFKRLIILESDKDSLWIKVVGLFLIALRLADWPYELAFHSLQQQIMTQHVAFGSNCLAQWGTGVIILNFVADALANLFLSGMFVRRLYAHIIKSRAIMSHRNKIIESIARKSLICLICTFIVNFIMNILKVTQFIGNRSDAFTPYFEIIESTLLVEALRVDYLRLPDRSFCEHCGMAVHSSGNSKRQQERNVNQQVSNFNLSSHQSSNYNELPDLPFVSTVNLCDNAQHSHTRLPEEV